MPREYSKHTTIGKLETKKTIEKFLLDRGIKFEYVLGYICFEKEGHSFRVNSLMQVKKALNIPI